MNERLLRLVSKAQLFSSVKRETLSSLLNDDNTYLMRFKNGEIIYSSEAFKDAIGIITSGNAKVMKKNSKVMVGKLYLGDIFGCQSLFVGKEFFTNEIVAGCDTKVLFINKAAIISIMQLETNFSLEYIRYLSGRIYYQQKNSKLYRRHSRKQTCIIPS